MKLEVPAALDGQRLDRAVATLLGLSRSKVADLVSSGAVAIDGKVVSTRSQSVSTGQELALDYAKRPEEVLTPEPGVEVPVVHEDGSLVVVDKPAGLVVHPGAGRRHGTLAAGLLARYPELAGVGDPGRPGIVHRLDAGTSGLMVVARTPQAYCHLVDALAARQVLRRYLALVWGSVAAEEGLVDAPVGRASRDRTRMAVSAGGRPARTRYRVASRYDQPRTATLLDCWLETGRTHQIRVHLSSIGHPVVGDDRYGGRRPHLEAGRPFLHATHLELVHPVTGQEMSWDSPLPADLGQLLAGLS